MSCACVTDDADDADDDDPPDPDRLIRDVDDDNRSSLDPSDA